MERMELLRSHQLLHPELVTEGMNRLAQALIALTDAVGKAAYDVELGIISAMVELPAPAPESEASVVVAEPLVDEDVFTDDAAVPPAFEVVDDTQEIAVSPGTQVVEWEQVPPPPLAEELPPDELPEPEGDPQSRRWIYTRLALMRRALRAWERLRPTLGDPNDRVDRPIRVVLLLEAVADLRPLMGPVRGVVGGAGEAGRLAVAVVRQPLLLDTIRRLLPSQREALAADWHRGRVALQAEGIRLRNLARRGRPHAARPAITAVARQLSDVPEIVPVLLGLLAVAVALVRWLAR